jgi:predicted esterase
MWLMNLYSSWWLRPGAIRSLTVGGLNRSYLVHVPNGHDPKAPLPVVLALHGATMNGAMMAWFSDLNRKADEAGFLAVYPNGTGRYSSFFWNGGNGGGSAMQHTVDDVAFISALLDDLIRTYPVDAEQIYATGMSNGAVMAFRLASELSDRIAAIAPVAGAVGTNSNPPKRPVSVLHFHSRLVRGLRLVEESLVPLGRLVPVGSEVVLHAAQRDVPDASRRTIPGLGELFHTGEPPSKELLDEPEGSSAPHGCRQAGPYRFVTGTVTGQVAEPGRRRKSFVFKYPRQESNL